MKQNDLNFGSTLARFRQLLRQNKYPETIVWLMADDVLLVGKHFVYVRVPIPDANETVARSTCEEGVSHGRGLLMSTICEMDASTCCYVWYPRRPEDEPQGVWPQDGSVKLTVKVDTSRVTGKPVKSRLLWAFFKLRHRRKQHLKDFLFS